MKKFFAILLLVFGLCGAANAQSKIVKQEMTQDGKIVTVAFDVETDVRGIPSRRKEVLKPFIYNAQDTVWLEEMMVYGKGRYMRERQVNHINGDKTWELGHNQVLKGTTLSYESKVPLKRWMQSANLGIHRSVVGCARCNESKQAESLAEGVKLFHEPQLPPRRTPNYVLVDAKNSWNFGEDDLSITFKVSCVEMDNSIFNNKTTYAKILEAVDKIYADPYLSLDKIQVAGYASPEGGTGFNTWLGENRALALIKYIIKERPEYNLTYDNFEIVNGEENWLGLRGELIAANDPRKDEVIPIIDNDELTNEEKKVRIKAIDRGRVWMRMLKVYYPHLRSARFLSVTYEAKDRHSTTVINQANRLIRVGRYAEAIEKAMQYSEDMRAHNTIGVALMLDKRFEEALPWFERALKGNCPSAQKNIDAIKAELKYEEEQRIALAEYIKQFD